MSAHLVGWIVPAWLLLAGLASAAPAPEAPSPPAEITPGKVPPSLTAVGKAGEDIFGLVRAKSWTKAGSRLRSLKRSMKAVRTEVKDAEVEKDRLAETIDRLQKAVGARDRIESLMQANRVTLVAANMSVPYKPQVPVEIPLLGYFGRELQVWSELNNLDQMQQIATSISETWRSVRPRVEAAGGSEQAASFDALVAEVRQANTVARFRALAPQVLREVGRLKQVFESAAPPAGPQQGR